MKRLLKIFVLAMTLVVTASCSAQYRAQRHMRRAIELCPGLVLKQSHMVDTFLPVPSFTDHAEMPFGAVLLGDTVTANTDHGKVTVIVDREEGLLHMDFSVDEQQIHYSDTVEYSQVVVQEDKTGGNNFWSVFSGWLVGAAIGIGFALWMLRNALKK